MYVHPGRLLTDAAILRWQAITVARLWRIRTAFRYPATERTLPPTRRIGKQKNAFLRIFL